MNLYEYYFSLLTGWTGMNQAGQTGLFPMNYVKQHP